MFFDELLETAYRRGTGVSRRYAQSSARVREITNDLELKPSRLATAAQFAEMLYLGERLADTAFSKLPKVLRQAALDWKDQTPDQQVRTLEKLNRRLSSAKWRSMARKNARANAVYGASDSVLPLQYGSWTRGPVQPNCLGMTQMMIGFARATGTPHLMANVIVRADEATEAFRYRHLDSISMSLKPFADQPVARALYRSTQVLVQRTARQLALVYRTQRAHHALVIQRSDGEWGMVDPYMHRLFRTHKSPEMQTYFTEKIYKWLMKGPDRFVVLGQDKVGSDAQDYLVGKFIKLLRRLLSIENGTVEQLDSVLRSLHKLLATTKDEGLGFACEANVWLKAPYAELLERTVFTYDKKEVQQAKAKLRRNKRELQRAYNRAIRRLWEITMTMMYSVSKHDIHPAVEVVHPTLYLGATTVHHLATCEGKIEPRIMQYVGPQFIMRDMLDGFEPFLHDAEMMEILRLRIGQLRSSLRGTDPLLSLPEIRQFLNRLER